MSSKCAIFFFLDDDDEEEKIHLLLNEVDLGAFRNCSLTLGTLQPLRTILQPFTDSETSMMMMIEALHKLFLGLYY